MPALLGGVVGGFLALGLIARTSPARASEPGARLGEELAAHKGMLSSPLFIHAVRYAASSLDDGMLGLLGAPWPLNHVLGDEGLGILGVGSTAWVATRLAPGNALVETPVVVKRISAGSVFAPTSLQELAERVPAPTEGGTQMRIERFSTTGSSSGGAQDEWIVYVGGTIDGSFEATGEPWDMTSNVNAIAGVDSGSYTATIEAMREAGIQPRDPLIVVGHSQGGIIATQIAASGEFGTGGRVTGLLTFGSPTGQLALPDSVVAVGVEHIDDLIPALGGVPAAAEDNNRLLVRRMVYSDQPPPVDQWLPAHSMENYRKTALLMDASSDERVEAFTKLFNSVPGASSAGAAGASGTAAGAAASGTVTHWRGDRLQRATAAASTVGR